MSVLLVVCARPKPVKFYKLQPSDYWLDLHEKTDSDIWCTAIFRVRKCIPTTVGSKLQYFFIYTYYYFFFVTFIDFVALLGKIDEYSSACHICESCIDNVNYLD